MSSCATEVVVVLRRRHQYGADPSGFLTGSSATSLLRRSLADEDEKWRQSCVLDGGGAGRPTSALYCIQEAAELTRSSKRDVAFAPSPAPSPSYVSVFFYGSFGISRRGGCSGWEYWPSALSLVGRILWFRFKYNACGVCDLYSLVPLLDWSIAEQETFYLQWGGGQFGRSSCL